MENKFKYSWIHIPKNNETRDALIKLIEVIQERKMEKPNSEVTKEDEVIDMDTEETDDTTLEETDENDFTFDEPSELIEEGEEDATASEK